MPCFYIIEGTVRFRDGVHVSLISPRDCTGGEVCRFRLHLVLRVLVLKSWHKGATPLPSGMACDGGLRKDDASSCFLFLSMLCYGWLGDG